MVHPICKIQFPLTRNTSSHLKLPIWLWISLTPYDFMPRWNLIWSCTCLKRLNHDNNALRGLWEPLYCPVRANSAWTHTMMWQRMPPPNRTTQAAEREYARLWKTYELGDNCLQRQSASTATNIMGISCSMPWASQGVHRWKWFNGIFFGNTWVVSVVGKRRLHPVLRQN